MTDGGKNMVSKFLIITIIIGVLLFLDMLILAVLAMSKIDRFIDDEAQLQFIREYNEKRRLKNAKLSKLRKRND